jgi:uncharacterized metal-binding protein
MTRADSPPDCAACPLPLEKRICRTPEGKGPAGCPCKSYGDTAGAVASIYDKPEIRELARQASLQEADGYGGGESDSGPRRPVKPRVLEIAEFARRLGCGRLGLAFCSGLRNEARLVTDLWREMGLEVVSVVCKVGTVPKESLGLTDQQKIKPGAPETMCNPVGQALLLDRAGTRLNVALGLCVGHDALFFRYSRAPATVLAAKDRLFGHNPLAALQTLDSYSKWLREVRLKN